MNARKTITAALFLTAFMPILFLPPLVYVFATEQRIAGLPLGVVYLFAAWAVVIIAALLLAPHLPFGDKPDERD
jgi:putative effector of murein hydrolase LrgA (UPF0299 family)